jgi:hypothetical protein
MFGKTKPALLYMCYGRIDASSLARIKVRLSSCSRDLCRPAVRRRVITAELFSLQLIVCLFWYGAKNK